MSKQFEEKELSTVLKPLEAEAEVLLREKDQMEKYLEELEIKFASIAGIGGTLAEIPVMISLVRAYIKGDYRVIPMASLIAIVAGLIYFMSPVDLIPDTIPVAGYLDDAAVIGFVLEAVKFDLEYYKKWKEEFYKS